MAEYVTHRRWEPWLDRVFLAIARRLPRGLVYWVGVRLWTTAVDARARGAENIAAGDMTCQEALNRWLERG